MPVTERSSLRSRLAVALAACLLVGSGPLPKGWLLGGTQPDHYAVEPLSTMGHDGGSCVRLASTTADAGGFATVMQGFRADPYHGRRLRFRAWVRTEGVESWAGLWMRVDSDDPTKALAFDNMQNRALTGTADWAQYEIVLDVAEEGFEIWLGALLSGPGSLWFDDVELEVVGSDVPTTDMLGPEGPANLDFEDE